VFVFTSDNGFFQGEHRVRRGKIKPYEPSVRVPALMRGPGVPRTQRTRQLTTNVDLARTIVDVTGATPGRRLDGVSLRQLARRPSRFARRDVLLQNGPGTGPVHPRYTAIRSRRYKYVQYSGGERELYDLRLDRFEQRSVHDTRRYRRVQRKLARKLRRLRACAGAGCQR
jgi:N-acetylglucosamine-6-sulfatase